MSTSQRRPAVAWYLTLTTLAITAAFAVSVVVNVASRMSVEAALSVAKLPVLGPIGLTLSVSMPAGLEILCFAFMMASTVGLLFWAGQGRGTAAAFMGLVWDVGAPILCGIALFTGLEDLAALRASMSGAVFAGICVLSLTRLFALVFTLRSGFFPVAGAEQTQTAG